MTKTIAVFGISGVGKSTLIEDYIEQNPNWTHLQAGCLIKAELDNIDHDKLRLEANDSILTNQYLMIDSFWREIDSRKLSKIIFDGHSIIDTGTELLPIPVDIIEALRPTKLIFIKVDARTIWERRSQDTSRDRPMHSIEKINEQQDIALKQFDTYGESLFVSREVLENPDSSNFRDII